MASEAPKPMTVAEAGRRGGNATKAKHGPDHYKQIGHLGGQKLREMIERAKRTEADAAGNA
jgi:general stress protein YciG